MSLRTLFNRERLRWSLQISPQVQAEQMPPGLLQQAFGAQASLDLSAAPGGGCLARIEWPSRPGETGAAAPSSPSSPTPLESVQR